MVLDHIRNLSDYEGLGIDAKGICEFIKRAEKEQLPAGRYELDGEQMFVTIQEYDTRDPQDCFYESHKNYMDIQYMAAGCEKMYVADIRDLTITEDRTPGEDVILYENGFLETALLVKEHCFALFMPQDGHMPCCRDGRQAQKVRKLVFKIRC